MADTENKETKETKEVKKVSEESIKPVETLTTCWLKSKAEYTIPIEHNGQTLFIPPFGKVKVYKEKTIINPQFTRYLTYIKL